MKLRFLQLIVFIAGCLGLLFICYPDCLAIFNNNECEKLHFRSSEIQEQQPIIPFIKDTSNSLSIADTMRMAI